MVAKHILVGIASGTNVIALEVLDGVQPNKVVNQHIKLRLDLNKFHFSERTIG